MKSELESLKEVAGWAQSVLTAWNSGDLPRECLLHKKLREVMIEHRNNIEILETSGKESEVIVSGDCRNEVM